MNRFKELRIKMGITQEDFRKQFNERYNRTYTAAAISQFENGRRFPEIPSLIDFADFYNVSIDYLIGHDNYKAGIVLTDEQFEILNGFKSLNEENKKDCFEYIEFLIQKQEKKIPNVKSSTLKTISRPLRKTRNIG